MATIKEIAKKAGVSYSSVSRALNNQAGVRPEIRKKVLEIAQELNYHPHSSAKALVQNRIGVLGVVIPRTSEFAFQNPYYSHMLLGLSSVANDMGYNLMLVINQQESHATLYHRHLVDGLIVVANRIDDPYIPDLVRDDVPTVVIPGYPDEWDFDIPSVNSENYQDVYRAITYLINLGHRDIAFILGGMNSLYSLVRLDAYKAAFRDKGLEYKEKYIKESDFSKTDAFRIMGELLNLPDPPSAVISINDATTPGVLHQINSRGLRIPEDISVVAIGCSDLVDLTDPPLTAIKVPVTQVGRAAARVLIELIEKGDCRERHVVIPSAFVVRESTGVWPSR
ncbi:MAG: LacI family transcriptional regulator [Deltaproteobacteria bacterium]|nr:LacI family transcriptional regulator [Deltaproteobacteria bacterium]